MDALNWCSSLRPRHVPTLLYHAETRAIMMTAKLGIITHSPLGIFSGYGARVCQSIRELVKDHFSMG